MDERAIAVLLIVALGAVSIATPVTAQSSSAPDVAVSVDGLPLDAGDVHHTSADPWMSVTVTAPEGETVRLVEVRVDGETRHVFEPSTRRVERNVVLDLTNGEHRITVVAKTGTVETHAATIVRDDRAPTVTFDRPLRDATLSYGTDTLNRLDTTRPTFVVDGTPTSTLPDVATLTVSNSTLAVAGRIEDDSEIRSVRIEHAYQYAEVGGRTPEDSEFEYDPTDRVPIHPGIQIPTNDDAGDPERVDTYFLPSPGDSFNRTVTLAFGTNYLRIAVEDALGNIAVEHVVVTVDDGTAPALNVTDVRYVSPTRLHVEGTVRDEVQVHDVWLEETLLTLDSVEADVDIGDLDGESLCRAADTLELENEETLCTVYDDATVYVDEEEDALLVRHKMIFPQPTVPDADRKRLRFNTTVYHPPGADDFVIGANDTALNERLRSYQLSTFLAPNVTVDDDRTGYVDADTLAVGGRIVDGQVGAVSVESVDPATGRVVDIRPVDLGANGSFDTRLGAAGDETQVRVRVRDASGVERLTNVTVSAPLEPTPTPTPAGGEVDAGGDGNQRSTPGGETSAASSSNATGGIRVPFVGVVIPVPSVGALGASVSAPLPVVGPVEIPLIAGVPILLVVAVAGVRARGG